MRKPSTHFIAIATAILAPGCERQSTDAGAADRESTFTAWDSAGIEIVENHAPEHAPGEFWTVDTVPEIVLGGSDELNLEPNDPSHLVWRIAGLARLPDGRVAILSSGNKRLMLFEPSGELSGTIGGPGEGPGEFRHPLALQYLPPDTLVVWDYFLTSIDYFDTEGKLLKERSPNLVRMLKHGVGAESLRLPLPDGSFLAAAPDMTVDESPGDCSHLAATVQVSGNVGGRVLRQETTAFGEEFLRIDDAYNAYSFGCARFGTHLAAGNHPPLVYISNDGTEIHQRSLDGKLVRIIRRTTDPPPVTDGAWRAELEQRAKSEGMIGLPRQTAEGDEIPRRETYPAVEFMLVDSEGHLWVREWSDSESGIPDQWSVFSPEGRWLGVLRLPTDPGTPDLVLCGRDFRPLCRVDTDFFLMVRANEFGVERVEGYRIRRGG